MGGGGIFFKDLLKLEQLSQVLQNIVWETVIYQNDYFIIPNLLNCTSLLRNIFI